MALSHNASFLNNTDKLCTHFHFLFWHKHSIELVSVVDQAQTQKTLQQQSNHLYCVWCLEALHSAFFEAKLEHFWCPRSRHNQRTLLKTLVRNLRLDCMWPPIAVQDGSKIDAAVYLWQDKLRYAPASDLHSFCIAMTLVLVKIAYEHCDQTTKELCYMKFSLNKTHNIAEDKNRLWVAQQQAYRGQCDHCTLIVLCIRIACAPQAWCRLYELTLDTVWPQLELVSMQEPVAQRMELRLLQRA